MNHLKIIKINAVLALIIMDNIQQIADAVQKVL